MAESTLAAAYQDLQGDIGFFLGYGRGVNFSETTWTAPQSTTIERCLKGGLRRVYYCGHPWSFLKPEGTVTLASGAQTVALPDDYNGIEGKIALSTSGSFQWYPLDTTSVETLYRDYATNPTTTGRPVHCCEEPLKGTSSQAGQRFQLRIWPIADQAYTLKFQYKVLPDYLSGAFPYVYGGASHAETFLAACKAVAERDLDDIHDGPQELMFQRLLESSKDEDRSRKPQVYGYNGDRSDRREGYYRRDQHGDVLVTYKGVQY